MAGAKSLKVGGHRIPITHPEKILYPAGSFTKAQVIDYYLRVARWLLPHFHDRPVTLKRYPDGVHGEAFYEKDAPSFTPRWVKKFPVPRREGGPDICYILINDRATLAWAANSAALELHPFLHRQPHLDRPTHVVFDLDPGEGTNILQSAEVAFLLRDLLQRLRLKSFPKVSGSKGLQLYVPLNGTCTYAQTQPFARAIAEFLEQKQPDLVVSDMSKNLRVGKIFIDWSQNADHKTTVGVYSLRAKRERPYVSMPVRWTELRKAIRSDSYDHLYFLPEQALQRLEKIGDLFAPVLTTKQLLPDSFAGLTTKGRRSDPASLATYGAKRNFTRTSEPAPEVPRRSAQGSRRRFVVQKHAASHLHYDFRLEMHDVLKSWAVPKGVPLAENETHTAFETEDHPVEYLDFEGIIPQGEYGGGTVMVWDIGTYEVVEGNYWKGALTISLAGKKLKGKWTLQRISEGNEKVRWLLRKSEGTIRVSKDKDISALTRRTMEEIAGQKSKVWRSNRSGAAITEAAEVKSDRSATRPKFVKPMKATAVEELPEGEEWLYEIKWDGYRALAQKHGGEVRLLSLKEKDLTSDFPSVAAAVRDLAAETALLDGEIVAVDAKGCPSFQALQNRASMGKEWQVVYYAFDLLNLQGADLTQKPLHERKAKLREIAAGSAVRYNAELPGSAAAVLRTVEESGLEGIVAKQRDSSYRAGTRVTSWRKLKLNQAQEFVIGGYKPTGDTFQSILVGYYEGRRLLFAGKVRQGFNPAVRARLLGSMQKVRSERCPFANLPTSRTSHFGEGITAEEMKELCWLKPKLVAQVSFTEWTRYHLLRHATYQGLRDDKEPRAIVREVSR